MDQEIQPPEQIAVPAPAPERVEHRTLITICVMMAAILQTLDSTIANVALPYMQGTMAASQEEISWVLTSYIVAQAVMTAPIGFLAGRFGRRKVFVMCIAGFTAASVLCGMAQSLDQIVFFRILQGACGASLMPLSQATLLDIYPPEQRGFATAIWITGALVGPILGPSLGGWLTEYFSWRSVFYINVPFGILAALGLLTFLTESPFNKSNRLDWIGFCALSLAIGAFQTILDRGETLDWFSSKEIVVETVLAALGFYVFLTQSFLAEKPFLSPRIFTDVNFVACGFFIFLAGGILYATMALLAPYIQVMMNYPVSVAGMVLAPRGAGAMLAAFLCGKLIPRTGARGLVAAGLVTTAWPLYEMTLWTPDVSEWTVASNGFLQGIGTSFVTVPLATVAFTTVPAELRAEAAGVFSLMRSLGSSIAISITAVLLEVNTDVNHATIAGLVTPFNRALHNGEAAKIWAPVSVPGAAALDGEITRQASIIAYNDDFKLMLICAVISMPLVLLVRKAQPNKVAKATGG